MPKIIKMMKFSTSQMLSLYIYGVFEGKGVNSFNINGINGGEVFIVPFRDIKAVVSNTQFAEYDPTEENVLKHEKVIQEAINHGVAIAPMRFCTILKTKNDLNKLLHSGYFNFKKNLVKIRNKHEFDVKVFVDISKFKSKYGEEIIEKSKEIAESLYQNLKSVADESVLSDQVTSEMIMNASFLILKDKREPFHDAIATFDEKYTDVLKIRISGPTAPYNFVSMPKK
jgi:spore cortex formation protein SpoVR/YcgB (stage V sporulation)